MVINWEELQVSSVHWKVVREGSRSVRKANEFCSNCNFRMIGR